MPDYAERGREHPDRRAIAPRGLAAAAQPVSTLTLVEGTTFCVSNRDGDIDPRQAHGLFVHDTRLISRWQLTLDGVPLEHLGSSTPEPYRGVILARSLPRGEQPEGTVVIERVRLLGDGMRETITASNYGLEPAALDLALDISADFADLFEVKDHRSAPTKAIGHRYSSGEVQFWLDDPAKLSVSISSDDAQASGRALMFRLVVPPRSEWSTTVKVVPRINGLPISAMAPVTPSVGLPPPAVRMKDWDELAPTIMVQSSVLQAALGQSQRDIGALRIVDDAHPDDDVVAAGAPWFMALFGRDSLITSQFMLPFAPELAVGTLRTLARLQGTKANPRTDEQPGRILHEVRLGPGAGAAFGGGQVNFGSIDSTPLFVQVCGLAAEWGVLSDDQLSEIQPAVRNALTWIIQYGDRDGDGFVEYERGSDRGLQNQGWKDSRDSMAFQNGHAARPPIALAEVQGYCYSAFTAGAYLEERWGNPEAAQAWRDRAHALKIAFHQKFWLPDLGFYAMGLDRDKRPLDVVSSNIGHVLWTGLADESVAGQIADRLMSNEMFTGFGIRTLSSAASTYNPVSYHNGSVWPHDTTIVAAGLVRYGFTDAASRITSGLIDAMEAFGGRLPELFCGFDREAEESPVPYPTSCMPQAWAAASPYELLRLSLNLRLDASGTGLLADPSPVPIGMLEVSGIRVRDREFTIHADLSKAEVLSGRTNSASPRTSALKVGGL